MKWKITCCVLAMCVLATLWTKDVTGQNFAPENFSAATCDIAQVLQQSARREALMGELQKMKDSIESQIKEKQQTIAAMEEELRNLNEESQAYMDKRSELENMTINLKLAMDAGQTRMEITHRRMTGAMVAEVRQAASRVAARKGISVVINSAYITPGEDTSELVYAPRIVYSSQQADITRDVIAEINAAFQASQP